jgi:hypothetical protein
MTQNQIKISGRIKSSSGQCIGYIDEEGKYWYSKKQAIAIVGTEHADKIEEYFDNNQNWRITDVDFGVKVYQTNVVELLKP